MAEEIRSVYISDAMRAKIGSKHGLSPDDVLDACSNVRSAAWHLHEEYGWRLLVEGWNQYGRLVQVKLYPTTKQGHWNLGTAQFG